MNQQKYRQLISGQSKTPAASLVRFSLAAAAQIYSVVIKLRNFLYSAGWLRTYKTNAAVISVGNITVGGTGKTPLVIWLCKLFRQKKNRCAVLTRGYKAAKNSKLKTQNYSDEPAVLAESCPQAKVIVNSDRIKGAAEAVDKFGTAVLVLDDGFQHRRLGRDLDIVTIDATCPWGYGKMLPAGLLREPVDSLKRADAVVITRSDQSEEDKLLCLENKLQQIKPDLIIAKSAHSPVCAKSANDEQISLEQLKAKKIFAFCGIGNPDAFFRTARDLGAKVAGSKIYNDHHQYTRNCLADIYEQAAHIQADLILTTQKDWSKIASFSFPIPLVYLVTELKFLSGESKLTALIEKTLAGKIIKN